MDEPARLTKDRASPTCDGLNDRSRADRDGQALAINCVYGMDTTPIKRETRSRKR